MNVVPLFCSNSKMELVVGDEEERLEAILKDILIDLSKPDNELQQTEVEEVKKSKKLYDYKYRIVKYYLNSKKKHRYDKIKCVSCDAIVTRCNLSHHRKTNIHRLATKDIELRTHALRILPTGLTLKALVKKEIAELYNEERKRETRKDES